MRMSKEEWLARVRAAAKDTPAERRARHDYYLREAGFDPATLTPYRRKKALLKLKKDRAKAKSAKQAHVKRLHEARKREAMPPWADVQAIQAVYEEARRVTAETGIPHEVDHIEPLLGKNASGLHVHYNLRVITRTENRRKGNRRV